MPVDNQLKSRQAEPPARQRDPWLDNARLSLMALVLVGHAIEPRVGGAPYVKVAYLWIYAFHMPLFAWLSGRVSSLQPSPARLIERLLLPYLLFQVLYTAAFSIDSGYLRFTQPYWILWFLVSLLCWRVMLPLVMALRGGVALAFGVALAAGLESQVGYAFSASRTLVFLPFFCLGFAMRNVRLPEMATPRNRALAVLVLLGLLALAWRMAPELDVRWLYGSIGYAELGVTRTTGIAARLAWQVAALLAGLAWLLLVPRRRLALTELGERSLYAFVLHGFLLRLATTRGWYAHLPPGPLVDFGLAAAAVALTLLLCSAPVRKLARPLVEPSLGRWLRH